MGVREVTYLSVFLRITVAFFLGGALGLERGLKQRPAGLRTHMLVCVGACMIMLTNQYIYQVFSVGDPVRMGAQVVSGIGFLGAGTIMVTKHSQIKGLTTAAGLWATAAVGLAVGIGFYEAAVMGTVVIVLTLTVLSILDSKMHRKTRCFEVYVELEPNVSLGMFLDSAYMSNLPSARIIHGKGTGILRAAVHAELKKTKYVKRFRLGTYGEGEDGVTIVEFA